MGQLLQKPNRSSNSINIQNSIPMLMTRTLSPASAFVILLYASALLLGQVPEAPTGLRIAPANPLLIDVPAVIEDGRFIAHYNGQPSGIWIPEWSTNGGLSWERATTEWAAIPARADRVLGLGYSLPRYTEISTNGLSSWLVRLRRIQ